MGLFARMKRSIRKAGLVALGGQMSVLAKNSLGEMCMSSPAMVPNALIIRTARTLYRIGESSTLE